MERQPTAAFVLTLIAGLWMLGTGGMIYGTGPEFMETSGMMGYGMMHGMMRTVDPGFWFPWFGPLAGIVLLVGAIILYTKPEQARTWGLVILIAAAINLFVGMGGFLAAVLGIVGGALAMSWKPTPQA